MDWIKFFTRDEPVAGLEVSDSNLRLTFLSEDKNKNPGIRDTAEEPLKEGVIVDGIIKDKENFAKSVKKLIGKPKTRIRYVIISIPSDKVYSKIFSFPKNIRGEKLKETMELSIGFQLPIKPEATYLDWERVKGGDKNEVLLSAVPKEVINSYISALEPTELKVIAAESHLLSLARSLKTDEKTTLVIIGGPENITVGVIQNMFLRFIHIISQKEQEQIKAEIKRIVNFYEIEHEPISKVILLGKRLEELNREVEGLGVELGEAKVIEIFEEHKEITSDNGKWLVSLGAAIRGLMPRNQDTLISLMPVGTEEAYEYQKAITFSKLVSDIVILTSIIFIIVFAGAWGLMLTIQQSLNNQYSLFASLPIPTEAVKLETRARQLNSLLDQANQIIKTIPMWSSAVEELKDRTIPGIIVTDVNIVSPETDIGIKGIAKDRATINIFKKTLEASSMFMEVNIPLTHLEKKEGIPFTASFKLVNPSSVYLE